MTTPTLAITGKDMKAFLADDVFWGGGTTWDDLLLRLNGQEVDNVEAEDLKDTDTIEILSGDMHWQTGSLADDHPYKAASRTSLDEAIIRWTQLRSQASMIIQFDKSIDVEALRAHIRSFHPSVNVPI